MFKQHPRYLSLVWLILFVLVPLPLVHFLLRGLVDQSPQQLFLITTGVIAYTWWLAALFLATRPAWLDRLIGLPEMYQVHAGLGFGAIILAFIHFRNLISMDLWVRLTGDWAFYLALFSILYATLFLSGLLVDHLPLATHLKSKLQHLFKHELSIWIHRLNLIVIGLVWLHVHLISLINQQLPFMLLFDGLTLAVLTTYAYQKLGLSSTYLTGRLLSVRPVASQINQLTVQIAEPSRPVKTGDFFFLTFPNHPQITKDFHPISVTSSDATSGRVSFTIQAIGDWTMAISHLNAGIPVILQGPFGQLNTAIEANNQPLILLGMGTGMAPLLSIAKEQALARPVHALWAVKNEQVVFDRQRWTALRNQRATLKIGRFTPNYLKQQLTSTELNQGQFVIVGSSAAVLNVERMLRQIGVHAHQIIDERLIL